MTIQISNLNQPIDIIGDIHGCYDELCELLFVLGYRRKNSCFRHKDRKAVFLGDLVDRGPKNPEVIELVMAMVKEGAYCIPGNHDIKLMKKLSGFPLKATFGMVESLEQLKNKSSSFLDQFVDFVKDLPVYCIFNEGTLIVTHAGLPEHLQGEKSDRALAFSIYGSEIGKFDDEVLPPRQPWYNDYKGKACVVFGHTTVLEPEWINNTIDIDTGCVFGGALTALRYPEKELISVKAHQVYSDLGHPLINLKMRS